MSSLGPLAANSELLTDACGSLRCAGGAAKLGSLEGALGTATWF